MAEAFGLVAGAVSIATAFTACVDFFEYVQFGRHFKRDFQTDLITLECARLRLTRWGQAVNVYDDPRLGRPDTTPDEIQSANAILHQVLVLFANTKEISEKYHADTKSGEDLTVLRPGDLDSSVAELSNKMRKLAVRRRKKGTSVLKTACWALYDRSEFKELIQGITSLIGNLETLFPAFEYQPAAQEEAAQLGDEQSLQSVQRAAQDVDPLLQAAATEALGHRYSNVTIQGKAQAGDAFDSDWKGNASRGYHVYDRIEVGKDGKALIGNKYGGKVFWDD